MLLGCLDRKIDDSWVGCTECRAENHSLAALDFVREVVLEAEDGELLERIIHHVAVELRRQHRGDVVLPVGEHDPEPLLFLLGVGVILVLQRAKI